MSGVPILASSANLARRPSATNFSSASKQLNGLVKGIIKHGESKRIGIEATVVGFDFIGNVLILRSGAATREAIQDALGRGYRDYVVEDAATTSTYLIEPYNLGIPVYLFRRQDNTRRCVADRGTRILITRDTLNSYWFNRFWDRRNIAVYETLEEYAANLYEEFLDCKKR